MANKPTWEGKYRQWCRMMKGNGYREKHRKGTHVMWTDDNGHNILMGAESHLRDELAWNMIRKYKLEWEPYL